MEEKRKIISEGYTLEAAFEPGKNGHGVVICHPHPHYGGDMDNSVVMAIRRAYRRKGFGTLRFNFRSVGSHPGEGGDGQGERSDVQAALAFLAAHGIADPDLAGYSFGAWINAGITTGFRRQVMVAPPLAFLNFAGISRIEKLHLVVLGSRDHFCPVNLARSYVNQWNPQATLEVLSGADHFFGGFIAELEEIIARHL